MLDKVATITEAGRAAIMHGDDPRLTENASAKLARKQAEARAAAEALNGRRADTTTPLSSGMPTEDLPADLPDARLTTKPKKPTVTLSATVEHRGRLITITVADVTVDRFCDLLDASQYAKPAPPQLPAPIAAADDLPEGWKLCQKHRAPMRPRNKQNQNWNSHNVGTKENPCWCKGYRGSDSPGYEVD